MRLWEIPWVVVKLKKPCYRAYYQSLSALRVLAGVWMAFYSHIAEVSPETDSGRR